MTQESKKPKGVWQFAVFALALVLAVLVWLVFPEPEESRRGYRRKDCYEGGKRYFDDARRLKGVAHNYPRSERYLTAVRYFEALERRFGIGPTRRDAYVMLADANHELALAGEADPLLRESFRLDPPDVLREEALRAYRGALARMEEDAPERPAVLRKEAGVLVELGRPRDIDEALAILRGLVKLYRRSKVDGLRRERGEDVEVAGGVQAAGEDAAEVAEEARAVYFLTGRAAEAAVEVHLAAAREAPADRIREEEELLAWARSEEAAWAFRLFIDAGGAGERRVTAEKALGDLAFRRARGLSGAERRGALEEARTHYRAAGTRQTAFQLARVLFGLGEYDAAKRRFAHGEDVSPAESRARSYMVARCDLAAGDLDAAAEAFGAIEAADPESAEAAASLVGLAQIALAGGELDRAARFLSRAVASGPPAPGGVELPERESELDPARLAGMLTSVAAEFDRRGEFDRAIAIYRDAARRDPEGPAPSMKLIARAWERKAEAVEDPERERGAYESAAQIYLELVGELAPGPARREAERRAAERFGKAGLYSRAIPAARGYVAGHAGDRFVSRVLHDLGGWEAALGLSARAEGHFRENIDRHPNDIYADRSRVELAKLLVANGSDGDLREAAAVLGEILGNRRRYGPDSLVRLEALFTLGRVQLRRAERLALAGEDTAEAGRLFKEAARRLEAALAFKETDFPAEGPDARPLFAELVKREGPAARKALARVRGRLAGPGGVAAAPGPLAPEELDRLWNELADEIRLFPARLAAARSGQQRRPDDAAGDLTAEDAGRD